MIAALLSIAVAIGTALGYTVVFYGLFLAYCAVHASKRSGQFDRSPGYVRAVLKLYLVAGGVFDLGFNLVVGPVYFREAPWFGFERSPKTWMFTYRCSLHRSEGSGWRHDRAAWLCDSWLNPIEPNHC